MRGRIGTGARARDVVVVGLLALLLAACGMGGGASDDEGTTAAAEGDATSEPTDGDTGGSEPDVSTSGEEISGQITFQTLQLKPTFTEYINTVIADFTQEYPDVEVEWVDIPFEGAAQQVITDASAGDLPDVINLNPDFALPIAQQGAFLNMDEAAADVKDQYVDGAWEAFVYPSLGHGVALPWYLSTEVTMYNAALFEAAGVDPSSPPQTFSELYENARAISDQTEAYGFHPALENRIVIDLAKLGVPIVNEDYTEAVLNTPEAAEYLTTLRDLYQAEVMPPDSVTQSHRDEINAYQARQIALFPSGANFLGIIDENAPDVAENTQVGPQITGQEGVPSMSVMGLLVPESTENPEAALAFAKFMSNADNQLEFSKIVTILPSVEEALQDPYFTDVEGEGAEAEARRISAEQITEAEVLRPVVVSDQFNQVVVEAAQSVLLGEAEPEAALSQAETEATQALQSGQ